MQSTEQKAKKTSTQALKQAVIQQGWLLNATHINSPFFNDRPDGKPISLLVIHNISLPPNQYGGPYVEQLFTGKLDPNQHPYFATIYQLKVSSHLFIRRDGEIIQFVPFDKRAWHAGQSCFNGIENCNDFSIGIELEGSDDDPFTESQYQKLVEVTLLLQQQYAISDIVGHSDIAPVRKTDPGPCFNWDYYFSLLSQQDQSNEQKHHDQVFHQLVMIKEEMQHIELWQNRPPPIDAFSSEQPFAVDTMQAHEWLQWVFMPRMQALIEAKTVLPRGFALSPYFEEALKEQTDSVKLLTLIKQLDEISCITI